MAISVAGHRAELFLTCAFSLGCLLTIQTQTCTPCINAVKFAPVENVFFSSTRIIFLHFVCWLSSQTFMAEGLNLIVNQNLIMGRWLVCGLLGGIVMCHMHMFLTEVDYQSLKILKTAFIGTRHTFRCTK